MNSFPNKGRLAAHVLLDAVSVARTWDAAATDLAYRRLADIEAFSVEVDDEPGGDLNVKVDLSDVLGASLITIDYLVEFVAKLRTGVTREQVIVELREYLDT